MGNRAHVIFHRPQDNEISPAVYLHWNGGPESVYSFLDELDRRGVGHHNIAFLTARFAHIVGDYFDHDEVDGLSLGVIPGPEAITPEALEPFDHGDNGVYVVSWDAKGKRVVRRFSGGAEWVAKAVDAERKKAYRHHYMDPSDGICAQLRRMRPFVSKYHGPKGSEHLPEADEVRTNGRALHHPSEKVTVYLYNGYLFKTERIDHNRRTGEAYEQPVYDLTFMGTVSPRPVGKTPTAVRRKKAAKA